MAHVLQNLANTLTSLVNQIKFNADTQCIYDEFLSIKHTIHRINFLNKNEQKQISTTVFNAINSNLNELFIKHGVYDTYEIVDLYKRKGIITDEERSKLYEKIASLATS